MWCSNMGTVLPYIVCNNATGYKCHIKDISWVVDTAVGDDFLGLCDQKKVHINICQVLNDNGIMTTWNLE